MAMPRVVYMKVYNALAYGRRARAQAHASGQQCGTLCLCSAALPLSS